jgi:hypothetical protein
MNTELDHIALVGQAKGDSTEVKHDGVVGENIYE